MKRLLIILCVVLFCSGAATVPDHEREIKLLTSLATQMEAAAKNNIAESQKDAVNAQRLLGAADGFHMSAAMLQVHIDARRAALKSR